VNNNFLSGQIPNVFANFERLDFIDVSNSVFSGTIPESLFSASTLRIAYLSNNNIAGTVPAEMANAPLLRDLFLDGNGLTGTVPEVAPGQLSELTELLFQFNSLTGSMPASVCDLRSINLEDLFSDCGGSNPEIECDFPGCCNRCFEGANSVSGRQRSRRDLSVTSTSVTKIQPISKNIGDANQRFRTLARHERSSKDGSKIRRYM
jgi:hypothetical protein